MLVETERLIVRPWREDDGEGAKAVYCDPEVRFRSRSIAVVNRLEMRYWKTLFVYGRDTLMYEATP